MHVGRIAEGKPQLMVLSVDHMASEDIHEEAVHRAGSDSAKMVSLEQKSWPDFSFYRGGRILTRSWQKNIGPNVRFGF